MCVCIRCVFVAVTFIIDLILGCGVIRGGQNSSTISFVLTLFRIFGGVTDMKHIPSAYPHQL